MKKTKESVELIFLMAVWLASAVFGIWWVWDSLPTISSAWDGYLGTVEQLAAMGVELPVMLTTTLAAAVAFSGMVVLWLDGRSVDAPRYDRQA